jgi:hypothetical protein
VGKQQLLAAVAVSLTPKFAAVKLNQKIEPTAVRELYWSIAGFNGTDFHIGEHVGIGLLGVDRIPTKYQHFARLPTKDREKGRSRLGQFYAGFLVEREWARMTAKGVVVPRRGLEPPRLAALVPETSASTNSATWAGRQLRYERPSGLSNLRLPALIPGARDAFRAGAAPWSEPP